MRSLFCCTIAAAILAATSPALAAPPPVVLTKDGKLAQPLVVRDVQGGFAGFNGTEWSVNPSGDYAVSSVRRGKAEAQKKGSLRPRQLTTLVKALARCDAAKELTPAKAFDGANPHVISVKVGERQFSLRLPPGAKLPKADPNKPPTSETEWFAAVLQTVEQAAGRLPKGD